MWHFFGAGKPPSQNHIFTTTSPQITIEKPRSADRFSQNPLEKHAFTTARKNCNFSSQCRGSVGAGRASSWPRHRSGSARAQDPNADAAAASSQCDEADKSSTLYDLSPPELLAAYAYECTRSSWRAAQSRY